MRKPPHISIQTADHCGQYCLAWILDKSIGDVLRLVGHSGRMTTKEMTQHFDHSHTKRGDPDEYVPALLMLRATDPKKRKGKCHWCIQLENNMIYDPGAGILTRLAFDRLHYYKRITSHIKIL